jgi:hypothetical protein
MVGQAPVRSVLSHCKWRSLMNFRIARDAIENCRRSEPDNFSKQFLLKFFNLS